MEPGEWCHMARLLSLITAAVSVCRVVGEGNLKYVMEPFSGERVGGGSNRPGLTTWLNPFFLTVGPADSRSGALAVETSGALAFL